MTGNEGMDLTVDQFIEGLFKPEALEQPSDEGKASELALKLPPWFDNKKFKLGQKFFWDNAFAQMMAMLIGLLAVIAVPSILKVLITSRRSSSSYTAYKRYLSTILHTVSWFSGDLAPGSVSWRSLHAVRSRHLQAGKQAKLQGAGTVSQRDLALTQFGFMGLVTLKPDELGIQAFDKGSWEGYVHFWRTIGYMIGLEDRYNICRKTVEETKEVCRILLEQVYTPCLENVPEHFEHMAFVLLDGTWHINPTYDVKALMYFTKYLAEVPGYLYTESERVNFREKLMRHLKDKPGQTGVDPVELMSKPVVQGLPSRTDKKLLYPSDFELFETMPEMKKLTFYQKYKLAMEVYSHRFVYTTYLGRLFFNLNFLVSHWLMENFPFLAFYRFGYKKSFVDIFVESPSDNTKPKSNDEFLKQKEKAWYSSWIPFVHNDT